MELLEKLDKERSEEVAVTHQPLGKWTNRILGAVNEQMIRDGRRTLGDEGTTVGAEENLEWMEQVGEQYWDDASGKLLDPEGVRQARAVEMGHVKELGVYRKVPIKQCWD